MVAVIKYELPAAIQTYLTTELNSLANDDTLVGVKIDNVTNAENQKYMGLELVLAAQGSARDSGATVGVFLLPSLDDTSFSYGDDANLTDGGNLLTLFFLDAATTARRVVRAKLWIPPFDFKLQVQNTTGQAFAASGTTLKYRIFSDESQ